MTPTYSAAAGDEGNAIILTMTVTSANACASPLPANTASAIYTINVDGLPTASAGGNQTICSSSSANVLGATSSNGTILWSHNGTGSITLGTETT